MALSENDICLSLNNLPDEDNINYPFAARTILAELAKYTGRRDVNDFFERIIKNNTNSKKIKFNALYCLLAKVWQENDYAAYRYFVNTYVSDFEQEKHIYTFTFKSQDYLRCQERNIANCLKSLKLASEAIEMAPHLPNVLHLFPFIVIDLMEISDNNVDEKITEKALAHINKAIQLKNTYSLYYETKAKLLSKFEQFDEAKALIRKAIEFEPLDGAGAALRIGNFQETRIEIYYNKLMQLFDQKQKQSVLELSQKQKESIDKLEEVRLKVVELLGLLSAIIAFLVTSVQVGKELPFQEAARLMVVSGGVILIIFSAYSSIFLGNKIKLSQIVVFMSGLIMALSFLIL